MSTSISHCSASYYSIWLVPQEPDATYFQGIIQSLASRFDTVSFCPHVTLYSGAIASDISHLYTTPTEPIELEIIGLAHEAKFAKTLYVQLRSSPLLAQLVSRLVAAIPDARLPVLDPHMSLAYHRVEPALKQTIIDTMTLPRPTIRFNQIQFIAAPENFETQTHVASLRCVHRQLLTPS